MLIAALLLGVVGVLFFGQVATSTARALPTPFGHVLFGGLAFGAAVTLVGVARNGIAAALIERAGLIGLSTFLLGYAVAVMANSGVRGLAFAVFVGAFSIANLVRVRQIRREIDDYRAARTIVLKGVVGDVDP